MQSSSLEAEVRVVRKEGMERQFEEAMQGASSGIDGCNTRRCQYHVLFLHIGTYVFQEGRFTRTGFARQENGLTGVLNQIQCILKFGVTGIYLHGSCFFFNVKWIILLQI